MKQLVFLVGAFAVVTSSGWGASMCVNGTLASYIALGSGGCMIGNDTVSMFQQLNGTAGGTELSAASVTISPSGMTANPELTFSVTAQALANQIFETLFIYRISGLSFNSSTITLSGSSVSGDGAITDLQTLCEGGTFGADGVSGCTGKTDGLNTVAGVQTSASALFAPAQFVSVTDDLTVDGGTTGTASGGIFSDQFTVPEPGSLWLFAIGAGFVGYLKKRSSARML